MDEMCKLKPGGIVLDLGFCWFKAYKHYPMFRSIYILPSCHINLFKGGWQLFFEFLLWSVEIEVDKKETI